MSHLSETVTSDPRLLSQARSRLLSGHFGSARSLYTLALDTYLWNSLRTNIDKATTLHIASRLPFIQTYSLQPATTRSAAKREARYPRIGFMATYPARFATLEQSLPSIITQIDSLYIYINEADRVPEFLRHPIINATIGHYAKGNLRDSGKFESISTHENAYIFTFDDDIIYPADYATRMQAYIDLLDRTSVVGVHGVCVPGPVLAALSQRQVYHFRRRCDGIFVDILGTGTAAWHSSTLQIPEAAFPSRGFADLDFAALCNAEQIPLFCVPRRANWLAEVGQDKSIPTLFQETQNNFSQYRRVYSNQFAPTLRNSLLRKQANRALLMNKPVQAHHGSLNNFHDHLTVETDTSIVRPLHFAVVITGWNCEAQVSRCLDSLLAQHGGPYIFTLIIVDDASTDKTFARMRTHALAQRALVISNSSNMGPAFSRHRAIRSIDDENAVVVCVDMDDALAPNALNTIANTYFNNPHCLLTCGNWVDQRGRLNPQPFYTKEDIDDQKVREIEEFHATHLRTFRRFLYTAVTEQDLKDSSGKWLETCTDVALMFPLLDQCWGSQVQFIRQPIYYYNKSGSNGTLARYGKRHKVERLNYLRGLARKPRKPYEESSAITEEVTASLCHE